LPCICNFPDLNRNCINEGSEILVFFGADKISKWSHYAVVIGFTVLFRISNYLSLRYLNTGKK